MATPDIARGWLSTPIASQIAAIGLVDSAQVSYEMSSRERQPLDQGRSQDDLSDPDPKGILVQICNRNLNFWESSAL